ncbi:hypothetical protein A0H81_13333 [Grifola frondosa]|uniref:Major facilitator superfamily (MFS) profile domain-containing protein n=1 Tax=Grifola frondosa TaxID=5627 RepID=A0A1C7LS89_GRIFR|nr:hypothetical protein A0H81_13333 [Grifola frondosa]
MAHQDITQSFKDTEEGGVEQPNQEGTFHQLQVASEGKAVRKHFFSPPDGALAEAVHRDAANVEYTEEEERAVKRKIDVRVLSLVICSYIFNQFDRTNIGNVHVVPAFNENFGITNNNKWTLALSIFYVGYCLLEMQQMACLFYENYINTIYQMLCLVLQRYIGANAFFPIAHILGPCITLDRLRQGIPGLLVLRVLLGIGEAGYYAGMIYYLSFWYKRHELAMRISLCMTGTLPGAISGLLAFGLLRAHTSVLQGWQFLFLIEAIPTLIMALMILLFLPSFHSPRRSSRRSHGGMTGWEGFKAVVSDWNSWLLMLIYASFGVATISYFLPTLIQEMGFTSINVQGMTVAPYVVGWFMVFFQAWHSDRTRDRGWHIMASTLTSCVGYIILATSVQKSVGAGYFALFLVVGGNYSLFPLVMSWAANVFSPTSKRGVGTAFIVSISNCVSIASPQIYFDASDDFQKGHAISRGTCLCHLSQVGYKPPDSCLFVSFLAAFSLRTRLAMLNKRNAEIRAARSQDEKDAVAVDERLKFGIMTRAITL